MLLALVFFLLPEFLLIFVIKLLILVVMFGNLLADIEALADDWL